MTQAGIGYKLSLFM